MDALHGILEYIPEQLRLPVIAIVALVVFGKPIIDRWRTRVAYIEAVRQLWELEKLYAEAVAAARDSDTTPPERGPLEDVARLVKSFRPHTSMRLPMRIAVAFTGLGAFTITATAVAGAYAQHLYKSWLYALIALLLLGTLATAGAVATYRTVSRSGAFGVGVLSATVILMLLAFLVETTSNNPRDTSLVVRGCTLAPSVSAADGGYVIRKDEVWLLRRLAGTRMAVTAEGLTRLRPLAMALRAHGLVEVSDSSKGFELQATSLGLEFSESVKVTKCVGTWAPIEVETDEKTKSP